MRRILAQARKELIQILRDKRALGMALVLPVTQLILMGSAISLEVKNLRLAVQDFDDSPASRQLVAAFRESITFNVIPFAVNRRPEEAFITNEARAVLIIPERFGRDLARSANTPIQVLVDASDSNTARLIEGYSSQITTGFNAANAGTANPAPVSRQNRKFLFRAK